MLINYFILISAITIPILIWRALLLDHPKLLAWIRKIPILGGALSCGFCTAIWFSLAGAVVYNPISSLFTNLHWIIMTILSWFVVSTSVLFLRNLLAILMEANGVLTDMHRSLHDNK